MSQPLPKDRLKQLEETILALPADKQWQVADFVDFLTERSMAEAEDWFWGLIGLIDLDHGDSEEATAALVDQLSKQDDKLIHQFYDTLAVKLSALDGPAYFDYSSGSADSFLYERALVVGQGKKAYNTVLDNPSTFPTGGELQYLLSIASRAYEIKHGTDMTHVPSVVYESFWNKRLWGEEVVAIHA